MDDARELRLALVLNGGVSLAVWISGVVHEIDRLRRAQSGQADTEGYDEALGDGHARVDVIAGASAGGINGALLAAAIQGGRTGDAPKPLLANGKAIRDVWLDIGDLAKLARPANAIDPPSLLRGDEYFLPALERVLRGLLGPTDGMAIEHPLYLYLTATALRSTHDAAFATSADPIYEPDHRVVFRFAANGLEEDVAPVDEDELSTTLPLDAAQATRLARAARATSSFPAAFPPHEALLRRDDGPATMTYLADGGILDNQPFGPVLDRVSIMPVTEPWRRVLLYVVPYVTEKAKAADPSAPAPGIAEVVAASGLSRDLPKLTSLERVEAARAEGVTAAEVTRVLHEADLTEAARTLFETYRDVQARELSQTVAQWEASPQSVGTDARGGDETQALTQARLPLTDGYGVTLLARLLPTEDWDTAKQAWRGRRWYWGLTKAERFARGALQDLRFDEGDAYDTARHCVTEVLNAVRAAVRARRSAYYACRCAGDEPLEAFVRSNALTAVFVKRVDTALDALMTAAAPALATTPAALFERLAAAEVVANVAGTRPPPPPAFDFYRVSAEGDVLGHEACTPEAKLAGMQAGHFAAFMKRSWRANDWMWGRLDGVRWLGRVLGQSDEWVERQQIGILREELAEVAKAVALDEREHYSGTTGLSIWRLNNERLLRRLDDDRAEPSDTEVQSAFLACRLGDMPERLSEEVNSRAGVALVTRLATVASRALSGAGGGLPGPARAAIGTTRRTVGLTNSVATTFARSPATGIAVVAAIAALAVVLAVTGSAVAWLSPALVAIALLVAWAGFGWISRPASLWRAVALGVLLAALSAIALITVPRESGWTAGWGMALVATAGGVVAWLVYARGGLTRPPSQGAQRARPLIGYALLVLLATALVHYSWDRLTEAGAKGRPAWERWFDSHEVLAVGLVVFVIGCLLLPLGEAVAEMRAARRRAQATPPSGRTPRVYGARRSREDARETAPESPR